MDYRGYGRRRGSGGDYTIAEIAGDALAVVDYLGWKRFSVLGHSMGGLAAQQVLADAPDRVQALVGVSPVPAGSVPFDDAGWALFSSAVGDADARRSIMDSSTGFRLTGTWLDAMVRGSLEHSDAEAFAAYLHVWSDTSGTSNTPNTSLSLIDRIQGKTLPVLIVAGEYDAGISGQFCRDTWLRYYPNAVLEVMANAGHYAMNETPVRLAKLIEDFLRDKL
jgi:pimeloyl-ACP methyl ester carboxylesterase